MYRRAFVASTIGAVITGPVRAAEQPSLRARLLGVWSLVEAVTLKGDEAVPWFDRHPPITGNIIYAENGWMSVQISGSMPGTIDRGDFIKLSDADKTSWFKEYYAYYGTFEVDEAAKVVIHHVVSSLLPYERGAKLMREVIIKDDVLTLLTPPRFDSGVKSFNRLVWKKVVKT